MTRQDKKKDKIKEFHCHQQGITRNYKELQSMIK